MVTTITAWLTAHLGVVVAGIAAAVIAWFQRDKIRAKLPAWMPLSTKAAPEPEALQDDGDGFGFDDILGKIKGLVAIVGGQADSVKRAIHLAMLVAMEDDVAALPDGPEKAEQLAAIQTLAKHRVVSQKPAPVVTT